MKAFFEPHVIISLAVIIGSLSIVAITLIIVLRDRISNVLISRTSVEFRTNDVPAWGKVVDRIEQIDSNTCKQIRKGTAGLMILDPEKYDMSAEAMLAIRDANQPLIYAAYENHHTRELKADADVYLADKAQDIALAVQMLKKQFPELSDEKSEAFAWHWLKKILLPNLRRACVEKVAFYKSQSEQKDISKTIKESLVECWNKNDAYIQCIDTLLTRSDIAEKSSIFLTPNLGGQ
jgi:hypothetical protein